MHIVLVSKKPQKSYNCSMANEGNLRPFKKGHDPRRNLKGRIPPMETNELKSLLLKYANQKIKVGDKMMSKMEVMAHQVVDDAVRGKLSAIKIFINWTEGKAPTHEQIMRRYQQEERQSSHRDAEDERIIRILNEADEERKKKLSQ